MGIHIDGKGDLMGLVREDLPRRGGAKKMAAMAGPSESPYTFYDKDICSRAQVWLHERGTQAHDKPGGRTERQLAHRIRAFMKSETSRYSVVAKERGIHSE